MSFISRSHYSTHHNLQPFSRININIPSWLPTPSPPPLIRLPFRRLPRGVRMDSSASHRQKDKVVVIIGATGCGKTKVSVDLATRIPSEIINSDKMQVYNGLDITTNKIPPHERFGVPHHLLGEVDPDDGDFTPSEFRVAGGLAVPDIVSRKKLPFVVGGSNSFIHSLLVDHFSPESDVFSGSDPVSTQLRYNCCFLWVDVALPVLCDYLCKRVDEMLDSGMFEELSEYYESGDSARQPGLRKAIGVPEFEQYFRNYGPGGERREWDRVRRNAYEDAVREIKENTCQLAKRQIGKIMKLKNAGWDLQRVDATEVLRLKVMTSGSDDCLNDGTGTPEDWEEKKKRRKWSRKKKKRWMELVWEREVLEPSVKIVKRFLEE